MSSYALDILIPHYRDPDGLRRSIESIHSQTWSGRGRIVIVDDGSPAEDFEKVAQLCQSLSEKDNYAIELLRNSENKGRAVTRNILLNNIKSPYVSWLDAGDVWYHDKIEQQFVCLDKLMNAGADANKVWISCTYDWEERGSCRTLSQNVRGDQYQDLLIGEKLRAYLWTLLGPAEAFKFAGHFDERLPRLQDLDYFLSFVQRGGRITSTDGKRPYCRYFKSDIGRNARQIQSCSHIILEKHRPLIKQYPGDLYSHLKLRGFRLAARFALANHSPFLASRYLFLAVVSDPKRVTKAVIRKFTGTQK